jgi:hypothetical protein
LGTSCRHHARRRRSGGGGLRAALPRPHLHHRQHLRPRHAWRRPGRRQPPGRTPSPQPPTELPALPRKPVAEGSSPSRGWGALHARPSPCTLSCSRFSSILDRPQGCTTSICPRVRGRPGPPRQAREPSIWAVWRSEVSRRHRCRAGNLSRCLRRSVRCCAARRLSR